MEKLDKPPTVMAFPSHYYDSVEGMTLRDYFAAKAMQGLLNSSNLDEGYYHTCDAARKSLALFSYQVADAMMEARNG